MATTVHILEASYDHEGSEVIAIYADKSAAEKKRDRMKRAQDRYTKAVNDAVQNDTDIKVNCPPNMGARIHVYSVRVKGKIV